LGFGRRRAEAREWDRERSDTHPQYLIIIWVSIQIGLRRTGRAPTGWARFHLPLL
jgi:hypothetical protein